MWKKCGKLSENFSEILNESWSDYYNRIKEQYDKLDILTTQKVLHDNFWRIRSKSQKGTDILAATMIASMFAMFFTGFPLIMVRDAITYSSSFASLASIFAPFVVGGIGASGYMIKRNKDHKKVFNKLNSQLGENALEEVYEKFEGAYEEQQELTKLIETQIRDISLVEVQLQEIKRCLDSFTPEDDNKEETKKQEKTDSILDNLGRKSVENIINNTTPFPDVVYRPNYYTHTTMEEEVQKKGPNLVKKRIPPKNNK